MKKYAFTLIELLVVIAIIAILAAILFPVFAQAKAAAKKAADLSNIKQLGTGIYMYTNDSDDMCPLQSGADANGNWGWNYVSYVPANWPSAPDPLRYAYSTSFFLNSLYPYVKNYQIYQSVGVSPVNDPRFAGLVAGPAQAQATSFAYNGLLSDYSSTAITSVAQLPMITESNGNLADVGGGIANPALVCTTPGVPCTYVGDTNGTCQTGNGATGAMFQTFGNGTGSYWINTEGENFAYGDSHAKYVPVGATLAPNNTGPLSDPMNQYASNGQATQYWSDGCFPVLFRPDFSFDTSNSVLNPVSFNLLTPQ